MAKKSSSRKSSQSKAAKNVAVPKRAQGPRALMRPGDTVDIAVRTETDRFMILDGVHDLPEGDTRLRTARSQGESGLTFTIPFEGGAMLARFRLGDSSPQEEAAWLARTECWLDLNSGWLRYGSFEGLPIQVPPGIYRVEVSCLTHSWGRFLLGRKLGEKLAAYLEQTVQESDGHSVEVVVRLQKLVGPRPILRLDRAGCAPEENWQVRLPLPAIVPLAERVYDGG